MLVFPVRLPGQMLAQVVRLAPQMFARKVAILRGMHLVFEHRKGEWNLVIDLFSAMVCG
jgi:hypothetical protein